MALNYSLKRFLFVNLRGLRRVSLVEMCLLHEIRFSGDY